MVCLCNFTWRNSLEHVRQTYDELNDQFNLHAFDYDKLLKCGMNVISKHALINERQMEIKNEFEAWKCSGMLVIELWIWWIKAQTVPHKTNINKHKSGICRKICISKLSEGQADLAERKEKARICMLLEKKHVQLSVSLSFLSISPNHPHLLPARFPFSSHFSIPLCLP